MIRIMIILNIEIRKVVPDIPPPLPEEEHDKEGDGRVGSSDKHVSKGSTAILVTV